MTMKTQMHNNQLPPHNQSPNLTEGLEAGDLARLINTRVTIDEYKSKIGSDDEIVVVTIQVKGKEPALDLVSFIEKSYDWVLDADASSGEMDNGDYLVFIEIDREQSVPENLVTMFGDLENLTEVEPHEWKFYSFKTKKISDLSLEKLTAAIPLTRQAYQELERRQKQDIDKLKTAAGVRVDTQAPKNDFTESLRIAAGIR